MNVIYKYTFGRKQDGFKVFKKCIVTQKINIHSSEKAAIPEFISQVMRKCKMTLSSVFSWCFVVLCVTQSVD